MEFKEQIAGKTDQELLDIYSNSGEYQDSFVMLARQELLDRGVRLEEIEKEKDSKLALFKSEFENGKKGNEVYIILGFISAVLGGLLGIIFGYIFSQTKHSGPDGERFYVYEKKTRDLGRIMMLVGVFMLLISLIYQFS